MATTKVSVGEYLATCYRPDVEYVDGELQERNLGEVEHAELVLAVIRWFLARENEWQIRILPDVRVQVAAERFRIPDLCICDQGNSDKRVVTTTPLLVIEVLSPEDRIGRYHERVSDYRNMGIRGIWTLDPETRKAWDCSTGDWIETTSFRLPGTPIFLDVAAVLP